MSLKGRSFACTKCDFEVSALIEDDEMADIVGSPCTEKGCKGTLHIMPGSVNLSGNPVTNIKTSGWFRERSQEMKKKIPNNKIGRGAASI